MTDQEKPAHSTLDADQLSKDIKDIMSRHKDITSIIVLHRDANETTPHFLLFVENPDRLVASPSGDDSPAEAVRAFGAHSAELGFSRPQQSRGFAYPCYPGGGCRKNG